MSQQQREYNAYLDCLRLIASVAVVFIHVSCIRIYDGQLTAKAWFCCNFYNAASRFCVPVFFMISGALFLDPARQIRPGDLLLKILRLLVTYAFWVTVYHLYNNLVVGTPDLFLPTLPDVLATDMSHLWFVPAMITCYLMVPILRALCRDAAALRYSVILLAGFLFAGSTAGVLFPESNMVKFILRFSPGFMPYSVICMLTGFWLHSRKFSRSACVIAGVLGLLATAFIAAAAQWMHQTATGNKFIFYEYEQLPVLLQSIAVFLVGKALFAKITFSPAAQKTLRRLGKYTFGAYLIHILIMKHIAVPMLHQLPLTLAVLIPAAAAVVFAISMLCSAVLNCIPVVRKYLC